mgnify:CR=1 FL=1
MWRTFSAARTLKRVCGGADGVPSPFSLSSWVRVRWRTVHRIYEIEIGRLWINEEGTNFCSFTEWTSMAEWIAWLPRAQESQVLVPLKRSRNLCLFHSFIIKILWIVRHLTPVKMMEKIIHFCFILPHAWISGVLVTSWMFFSSFFFHKSIRASFYVWTVYNNAGNWNQNQNENRLRTFIFRLQNLELESTGTFIFFHSRNFPDPKFFFAKNRTEKIWNLLLGNRTEQEHGTFNKKKTRKKKRFSASELES